jgi:hypothetical protein
MLGAFPVVLVHRRQRIAAGKERETKPKLNARAIERDGGAASVSGTANPISARAPATATATHFEEGRVFAEICPAEGS